MRYFPFSISLSRIRGRQRRRFANWSFKNRYINFSTALRKYKGYYWICSSKTKKLCLTYGRATIVNRKKQGYPTTGISRMPVAGYPIYILMTVKFKQWEVHLLAGRGHFQINAVFPWTPRYPGQPLQNNIAGYPAPAPALPDHTKLQYRLCRILWEGVSDRSFP